MNLLFWANTVNQLINQSISGVQKLLDALGQQGSWMPSKIFSIIWPAKFLITFVLVSPNFSLFCISCHISRKFAAWMPPSAASCPGNEHFSVLFLVLRKIFTKSGPLDAPMVDARGCRTVRTPLCMPLGKQPSSSSMLLSCKN